MKIKQGIFCLALLGIPSFSNGAAEEWTRFRGPNGSGVSQAKTIPSQWTGQEVQWKSPLPGEGHSSPVIWGGQIFVLGTDKAGRKMTLLNVGAAKGDIAWQRDLPLTSFPKHRFNSYASGSPAADAHHVYVAWMTEGDYQVTAFSHSGEKAWQKNLGPFKSQHGPGASPIVHNDMVIMTKDQDGESFIIALDAKTGAERWRSPRGGQMADYSTPCVYQAEGEPPVLVFNALETGITGINPQDGSVVWEYSSAFDKRSVSSPLVASGLIFGSCGSGQGGKYVVAVRPGNARGKKAALAYEIRRSAPYVPTSVAWKDWVFLWGDDGVVTCLDAPSGDVRWQERAGGDSFGSPICVDGRIFGVSTAGEVVVLEASDRFRVLGRNPLGETTHATPAVAGGRLYIRTLNHLISIGNKTGS